MNQPDDSTIPINNRILAALPRDDYECLSPNLELVRLPKNRILSEAGEPMRHVYFLNSGIASMLAVTENGETIEIATVGSEGFIGLSIIPRSSVSPYRVMTQTRAEAIRIDAKSLLTEFNRGGRLHEALLLCGRVLETQIVQAVVCNLFHPVEQRFARRLLIASDCVHANAFDLTQEEIANLLGKDRSQVGAAASALRQKGLIQYQRGCVTILDRAGLREASCECYRIVRASIDRFLTP